MTICLVNIALVANPMGVIIEKTTGMYDGLSSKTTWPTVIWQSSKEHIGSIYDENPIDKIDRIKARIPKKCLVDNLMLYITKSYIAINNGLSPHNIATTPLFKLAFCAKYSVIKGNSWFISYIKQKHRKDNRFI